MAGKPEVADHYVAHYRDFGADLYGDVRREAYGVDVGQNSWLTVDELERFGSLLELGPSARLLDVACGSGGPALHLARVAGCAAVGVDLYEEAVAHGNRAALEAALDGRVSFLRADASRRLPFPDGDFDALLCIDAIHHLPDRPGLLAEWKRLLRVGGRLVFTDSVVVTGRVSADEIAIRASIGYFLFLPPGENEQLLRGAGLDVIAVEDTTEQLAEIARRRFNARANHADVLARVEGEQSFGGRQGFFDLVATLADERRLSRLVYTAARRT